MLRFSLIATLILLAACGGEEKAQVDYSVVPSSTMVVGDRLNQAMLGDPPGLLPMLAMDATASDIGGNIFQALLTYDKDLNLIPNLAERYEVSNAGKTITFYLKKGVTFSDGEPLTSADVLATYEKYINPETKTAYAGDYLLVEKAEAVDKYTFRVTYPEPFVPAMSSWAGLLVLPKHVMELTDDFNQTTLKDKPVGSGSYVLNRWRRGQDVLLTRNPSSTEAPNIEQVHFRLMPDQNTQFMALRRGELDMAGLSPLAYSRLTDADWFTQNYNKYSYLSNSYTYLGFNLKREMFADKRVRQALSYAVDRNGLIAAVLFGQGQTLACIFKPGTWACNSNLEPYPRDLEKAKSLLAEAGWADSNGDGVLDKDGKPFVFTIVTNQGNDARIKTAQILQANFAEVGVKVEIRVQEWSTFLTNTLQPRAFDAILMGWALGAEPDPYDIWHSSKTKAGEFNMISYNNARVDELIMAARKEFNKEKRQAMVWEVQEILHEEQPYLWLYAPNALVAVHKRIQGIVPAPAGLGYNFPQWFVPEQWQLRTVMQ